MNKTSLIFSVLSILGASALFMPVQAGNDSREHIAWKNIEQGALIIDARTAKEYAGGHISGAINIPFDIVVKQFEALRIAKDRQVVLYCRSGNRSGKALASLEKAGYSNLHNGGGFNGLMAKQH